MFGQDIAVVRDGTGHIQFLVLPPGNTLFTPGEDRTDEEIRQVVTRSREASADPENWDYNDALIELEKLGYRALHFSEISAY